MIAVRTSDGTRSKLGLVMFIIAALCLVVSIFGFGSNLVYHADDLGPAWVAVGGFSIPGTIAGAVSLIRRYHGYVVTVVVAAANAVLLAGALIATIPNL